MKIKFDIDCTPGEARAFFGLPDVKPLQDAMMADVEERLRKALTGMDAETLMKTWFPANVQSFQDFEKAFWSQFGAGGKEKGKGGKEE